MTDRLPEPVDRLLRSRLGDAQELLPFARAVVLHLARAPGQTAEPGQVASTVLAALEPVIPASASDGYDPGHDVALLSSFFQNADLLDPHSPRTRTIARGVMAAIERMGAHR